jgi:hypothetical protein
MHVPTASEILLVLFMFLVLLRAAKPHTWLEIIQLIIFSKPYDSLGCKSSFLLSQNVFYLLKVLWFVYNNILIYQYYISVHIISVNLCQYSDIYCSETLHSLYTVWI